MLYGARKTGSALQLTRHQAEVTGLPQFLEMPLVSGLLVPKQSRYDQLYLDFKKYQLYFDIGRAVVNDLTWSQLSAMQKATRDSIDTFHEVDDGFTAMGFPGGLVRGDPDERPPFGRAKEY